MTFLIKTTKKPQDIFFLPIPHSSGVSLETFRLAFTENGTKATSKEDYGGKANHSGIEDPKIKITAEFLIIIT